MRFQLGTETIVAKNDGGIHLAKYNSFKRSDVIYPGRKTPLPVLSFEVLPFGSNLISSQRKKLHIVARAMQKKL